MVWDLDNTLWDGVLLEESGAVVPRSEVVDLIRRLDRRGILHSIASRNDRQAAMERLGELGLDDMFVYPQIGWNPKSSSLREVARSLNVGIDALAFVDDEPFERAEVAHALPGVLCLAPEDLAGALDLPELTPRFVTDESARRRDMYRSQTVREEQERTFAGTPEEFLAELKMEFTIRRAGLDDLQRAEELTVRTNQLNSTGRTYSYEELAGLSTSPDHVLLVAELTDRYGSYGTIGLALAERGRPHWHLRLLLMSCRTMSRGVGTILLNHVMRTAKEAGAEALCADFVETGRNRMMQITYAFAGFTEVSRDGTALLLKSDLRRIQDPADYIRITIGDDAVPTPATGVTS
ncbi:HAD-IIIC family phosphatase [Streptomyces phaeofaciens JCM 4814]|uniref:Haloacid dehalogenase n=1 Tax=Streptomyces phaeofaciens TaxID=68254 RepID=A0A918HLT5_9ACTN|nr:haloacid dehalogenase [Streptomyces phaeofaciens]